MSLLFFCRKCFVLWPDTDAARSALQTGDQQPCPECEAPTSTCAAESWMKGLCVAQHTELSDDARRKMSIAGAKGPHPGPTTPDGRRNSSMNALVHGAYAKRHLFPRAKPGLLHDCAECPFAPQTRNPIGDGTCQQQNWTYCIRHTEVIAAVINAHHDGGAAALRGLLGQAQGMAMINLLSALRQLSVEGPTVEQKTTRKIYKADGSDEQIENIRVDPNPTLIAAAKLAEILGLSLKESNLTARSATEEKQTDNLQSTLERIFNRPPAE